MQACELFPYSFGKLAKVCYSPGGIRSIAGLQDYLLVNLSGALESSLGKIENMNKNKVVKYIIDNKVKFMGIDYDSKGIDVAYVTEMIKDIEKDVGVIVDEYKGKEVLEKHGGNSQDADSKEENRPKRMRRA